MQITIVEMVQMKHLNSVDKWSATLRLGNSHSHTNMGVQPFVLNKHFSMFISLRHKILIGKYNNMRIIPDNFHLMVRLHYPKLEQTQRPRHT